MAREEAFWRELDNQLRRKLTNYVNSLLLHALNRNENPGYAEDVANETFREAYRDFQSFDSNRGELESWLFGIARNQVYKFLRDHGELKNERSFEESDLETQSIAQESELVYEMDVKDAPKTLAVRKALKKLSQHDQELLICCYGHRLSYEEMERYFNFTVRKETLRVQVKRAKTRLHKELCEMPEFAELAEDNYGRR